MSRWNPDNLIQAEIDALSSSIDALRAVNRTLREACRKALRTLLDPKTGEDYRGTVGTLQDALRFADEPFGEDGGGMAVDNEGDTVEDLPEYVVSGYVPFVA